MTLVISLNLWLICQEEEEMNRVAITIDISYSIYAITRRGTVDITYMRMLIAQMGVSYPVAG